MSNSQHEADDAVLATLVNSEQGLHLLENGDQHENPRQILHHPLQSTSLLTQGVNGNAAADGSLDSTALSKSLDDGAITNPQPVLSLHNHRTNAAVLPKLTSATDTRITTSNDDSGTPTSQEATPTSTSFAAFNLLDYDQPAPRREQTTSPRVRGISMERTEKEKRVNQLPEVPFSSNPGDTGMIGPLPVHPTIPIPISMSHPTEGVRASYRSWRDARPNVAAEKTWSIGGQVSDDSHGGQVEKSVTDALAGVEPNNRSRKSSHSMRFFKEGLPEDKSQKRDNKGRGLSKEDMSRGKSLNGRGKGIQNHDQDPCDMVFVEHSQNMIHSTDKQTPLQFPLEREYSSSAQVQSQTNVDLNIALTLRPEDGYFDTAHSAEPISEEQMKAMPAQLLAEIRKHHNLTPGAGKGSSFSRSIPVTESERPRSDVNGGEPRSPEKQSEPVFHSDVKAESTPKGGDEDDESEEEQISSALFVPHQTPRETPEEERSRKEGLSPIKRKESHHKGNRSQQWLEEHEVLSSDVDPKYIGLDTNGRSLQLSSYLKALSPLREEEDYFPGVSGSDVDQDPYYDDAGYSTKGEDSSITDDLDAPLNGSLKHNKEIDGAYKKHLHDHQQEPRTPLEAIELIPYRHQVGGHTTMWRFSKRAVCKQLNNRENEFYEKVEHYHADLLDFLPRYVALCASSRSLDLKLSLLKSLTSVVWRLIFSLHCSEYFLR